jgi:hypothetical protein
MCALVLLLSVAGCARAGAREIARVHRTGGTSSRNKPGSSPGRRPTPSPDASGDQAPGRAAQVAHCQVAAPGFSCGMQQRIRAVEQYLATQPGEIGIVLHDRVTGATWENSAASTALPAASTIKLAMMADLMLRSRDGSIDLGSDDWDLIYNALHSSSDTAADQLWSAFEDSSFLSRIQAFGMNDASFSATPAYWGYMYCSAEDLSNLMNYVLDKLPASNRDYIVSQLRHVAPIQQWGVWGAGQANEPGNKDGWEDDNGVWFVNTVGFAGPNERYTLAIMDDLKGAGDFHEGSDTLSQVASLLFQGRYGPAPVAEATP